MSIVPNLLKNSNSLRDFFEENIHFRVLQVQKNDGYFGKVKKTTISKNPNRYNGIQINWNGYTNALAFDCDHDDVLLFQDFNLPQPTLTTINENNGRHHHLYFLDNPVPLMLDNPKTKDLLCDVKNGLTKTLQADINYTGFITKNFTNTDYRVIGSLQKYKLTDFTDFTASHIKKTKPDTQIEQSSFSRHLNLFDEIRFYGYTIAKKARTRDELYLSLFHYAEGVNKGFNEPIITKYIVKSVTDFCWTNKNNFNDNKWNWEGYAKQDNDISYRNRCKREKTRRMKEALNRSIFTNLKFT